MADSGKHSNVKFELVQKDDNATKQHEESKPQMKAPNTPLKSTAKFPNDSQSNEMVHPKETFKRSKEHKRKDWPDVGDFFDSVAENFKKAGNAVVHFFKKF